jgi:transposase
MQKALTQMNIQLDSVVSNLTGKTGLSILRHIVAGERDPQKLATLRDRRLRATQETVARSLHGNWRQEHLFALSQALAHYDFLAEQIAECDQAISEALGRLPTLAEQTSVPVKLLRSPHRSIAQQTQLHQALNEVLGVDLTTVPTLGIDTVLVLAGEIGADLSRFPTSQHFCSWLGLAPSTHISGGKHLSGPKRKVFNAYSGRSLPLIP